MRTQSGSHAPLMSTSSLVYWQLTVANFTHAVSAKDHRALKWHSGPCSLTNMLMKRLFWTPQDSGLIFFNNTKYQHIIKTDAAFWRSEESNLQELLIYESHCTVQTKITSNMKIENHASVVLWQHGLFVSHLSSVLGLNKSAAEFFLRHQLFLSACCYWKWWHLDSRVFSWPW